MSTSFSISSRIVRMLAAVDFNDEPRIDADEIRDIALNRHLPEKLPAVKLPVPQMPP
jgi:hypothetical protein